MEAAGGGRRVLTGTGDPLKDEHTLSKQAATDVGTVAKGGAVQIVGQITARSAAFFFNAIAFRVLEAAGFGLYRQVAQVLSIAGQLGLAGFNYAAMRFITLARVRKDAPAVRGAARVSLAGTGSASLVVMAGIIMGADLLAGVFKVGAPAAEQAELADLFRVGAVYVPLFGLMQVLRYCTQAYKTMVPSVVVGNIIQPAARFAIGVGLLAVGASVTGAVGSLAASMAVGSIAGVFAWRRILTQEERSAFPCSTPGPMIRFALPQGGSSLLGVQSLGLGVIILGIEASDAAVGLFAVALALQGPGGVFLSGIVNIWAPVVSDLHDRGAIDRLQSLYQTITRWVVTFSFPVYAALILEPDLFVQLFGGSDAAKAAPYVAVLAVGNFFYTGTGPTGYVLSMTGRPGVNFVNSLVGVILYIAGGIIFVPRYGVLGMAVVDAVVTSIINTARVIEAKILVGVQPFGRSVLKPIAATALGAVILLAWRLIPGDSMALEGAGIVVAGAVYFAALKLFGLDPEERYVWERIRRRGFRRKKRPSADS